MGEFESVSHEQTDRVRMISRPKLIRMQGIFTTPESDKHFRITILLYIISRCFRTRSFDV